MRLGVIGVPTNSAGVTGGEAAAPDVLREAGLIDALSASNDVHDYGNVSFEPAPSERRDPATGIISPQTMVAMIEATRGAVRQAYEDGRLPLVVGGDCPLLLGCLLAARDQLGKGPGLLFVDGHEDAYPPTGSMTGEAADMELGLAVGFTTLEGLDALAAELPIVDPHDVVLLGPRDRAEVEGDGLVSVSNRVIVLDDAQLRAAGVEMTTQRWLDQFHHRPGRFWFHLDWDVLSSDEMPAVSYPQPGGMTWDEIEVIASKAFAADHLIGVDATIYNPDLDPDRSLARRIVQFLAKAIGEPEPRPRLGRLDN
jgi:arginase